MSPGDSQGVAPISRSLYVVCHNVRSIGTASVLRFYTEYLRKPPQPDILLFNEVWKLEDNTIDDFFTMGYSLAASWLRDPTMKGGGVCIFVKRHTMQFAPIPLTLPTDSLMEACACWVGPRDASPTEFVAVASVYVPPIDTGGTEPDTWLERTVRYLDSQGIELIAGDFNARHIAWCPTLSRVSEKYIPIKEPRNRGARLYSFTNTSSWTIANTREITRRPSHEAQGLGSAPDVVIHQSRLRCTFSVFYPSKKHPLRLDLFDSSDHLPIRLTIEDRFFRTYQLRARCPQIAWQTLTRWQDIQQREDVFLRGVRKLAWRETGIAHYAQLSGMVSHVLRTLPRVSRQAYCTPVRLPAGLAQLRAQMNVEYNAASPADQLAIIHSYRQRAKEFWEEREVQEWNSLVSARVRDATWMRAVWHKYRNTTHTPPPALRGRSGRPLHSSVQARLFRSTFMEKYVVSADPVAIAYAQELTTALNDLRGQPPSRNSPVSDCNITAAEVQSAIAAMNAKQAADTWGMKPEFLLHLSPNALELVAATFSTLLRDAQMPKEWLRADTVPLYKGTPKDPGETTSYRPVSITNLLCRVYEMAMGTRILLHMRDLPCAGLHPRQFGFRRGVSAEMALGCMLNDLLTGGSYCVTWALSGHGTLKYSRMVVAVDFSDAFCRVTPDKVEWALRKRGCPEPLCNWARAYMTGRQQRVFVNGTFSEPFDCPIGCPQGSVIGPLLWNLAMNDLLESLETFCEDAATVIFKQRPDPPARRKKTTPTATEQAVLERRRAVHDELVEAARTVTVASAVPGSRAAWPDEPLPKREINGPLCGFTAYADDLTIWVTAHSPRYVAGTIQCMLNRISLWARQNGIAVSSKTEGRWISDSTNIGTLQPLHPVALSIGTAKPILIPTLRTDEKTPPLRILGLWVDPHLTFKPHTEIMRKKVAALLLDMSRRMPFMPPSLRYIVLRAVAAPYVLALTAVFWEAASKRAKRSLRNTWKSICFAITCAMRTAKGVAVIQEAGLRPLDFHVQKARLALQGKVWMLREGYAFLWAPPAGLDTPLTRCIHARGHRLIQDRGRWKQAWRHFLKAPPSDRQRREFLALTDTPISALSDALHRTTFLTTLSLNGKQLPPKASGDMEQLRCFNTTQLAASSCAAIELWTDGSVVPSEESGGAYVIVRNGAEVDRGTTSLGTEACSYSMERAALVCGLRALAALMVANDWSDEPVRIVTDSLSCLSELQRGPFRQEEEQMEEIWQLCSRLKASQVFLVFVFSHTEATTEEVVDVTSPMRWNTMVDKLAEEAQSDTASGPQWPRDIIRPNITQLMADTDESPAACQTLRHTALGSAAPSTDIQRLRLPRAQQRLLIQLRTGATHRLPGWRSGKPKRCLRCAVLVGRESTDGCENAVAHLFDCIGFAFRTSLELESLWTKPAEAVKYFRAFVGEQMDGLDGSGAPLRALESDDSATSDDSL